MGKAPIYAFSRDPNLGGFCRSDRPAPGQPSGVRSGKLRRTGQQCGVRPGKLGKAARNYPGYFGGKGQ